MSGAVVSYKSQRFASPVMIIAFIVVMLGVLYLVFPKEAILEQTLSAKRADELSLSYLNNLLAEDPQNQQVRLKLTEQELQRGEWRKAQQTLKPLLQEKINNNLKWQSEWLKYEIQRSQAIVAEKGLTHAEALEQLRGNVNQLANAPLKNEALNALAQDALTLNMPKVAVSVYKRMLNSGEEFDAYWYAHAGKIALSTKDYNLSSRLYFEAFRRVEKIDAKREYYLSGLRSLQSGDKLDEAIKVSETNIGDLKNDRETLVFLTRLALAANRPQLAEKHMQAIMRLNVSDTTIKSESVNQDESAQDEE